MTACFIDSDLEHGNFLNTDISQGSVVTQLRCGGIVNEDFLANLLVNLSVKEFWKSVNIWQSCGQYYSGLFFNDSQCRIIVWGLHYWLDDSCLCFWVRYWMCAAVCRSNYGWWKSYRMNPRHEEVYNRLIMKTEPKTAVFSPKPTETDRQEKFWNRNNTNHETYQIAPMSNTNDLEWPWILLLFETFLTTIP